ncbi:hypothetical protein GCM10023191_052810 [Actinoallomurus oryzae]|uniref:Transposase n=1 Tax=Actinoallomurus oryzae TaxID=502180 RepID=A0ABP8QE70_9ACTN
MRFRLQPTPAQEQVLLEHCTHARYVWNLACEQQKHRRPGRTSTPGHAEQSRRLTEARRSEDKATGRVEKVASVYTSQTCNACGRCAADNRESRAVFRCRACGHTDNADVNTAENIAAGRAVTFLPRPTDPGRPPERGALQPLGGVANREPQPALSSA